MLACWIDDPDGDEFKKHLARFGDYFWLGEDGMKVQVVQIFLCKINILNAKSFC